MKYFFVGIKGVGVCGVATIYKERGDYVLGSDTEEVFFTDAILERLGISVVSFDPMHITGDIAELVYSTAYGDDHPQIARARELGIPVASYTDVLARMFNEQRGIVVTGSHGKTTSSAMLGRVLEDAGFDPTVIVGGELIEWQKTARAGTLGRETSKSWMVVEGDEYQAKILALKPYAVLITNIDYDHPDFYPTEGSYRDVFKKLLEQVSQDGLVVAHESLREFVTATIYRSASPRCIFFDNLPDGATLSVWGEHNRVNAAGVLAMARALGISDHLSLNTLKNFRGTRRRMELYTKEDADVVVLDDYAHHPTEIRATLRALREHYPKRKIIAVFQSHTYSRTKTFLNDFAQAFADSDSVIIAGIYSSAREKEATVSGDDLASAIRAHHKNVFLAHTFDEAFEQVKQTISTLNTQHSTLVIVTLGAGDVWQVAARLSKELGSR